LANTANAQLNRLSSVQFTRKNRHSPASRAMPRNRLICAKYSLSLADICLQNCLARAFTDSLRCHSSFRSTFRCSILRRTSSISSRTWSIRWWSSLGDGTIIICIIRISARSASCRSDSSSKCWSSSRRPTGNKCRETQSLRNLTERKLNNFIKLENPNPTHVRSEITGLTEITERLEKLPHVRSSLTKTRVRRGSVWPRIGCPQGAAPPFERMHWGDAELRFVRTPSPPRHERPTAPTRATSARRRNRGCDEGHPLVRLGARRARGRGCQHAVAKPSRADGVWPIPSCVSNYLSRGLLPGNDRADPLGRSPHESSKKCD
jgi:hypothetical protein